MEALKELMSESDTKVAESSSSTELISQEGELLVIGCVDWNTNLSAKDLSGLEEFHRVHFPYSVRKVFSSSNGFHSLVLLSDGSLYSFGKNDHGQLGSLDEISRSIPVQISEAFPSPIVKAATGRAHSLVLLENGQVFGCGSNVQGQLGLGENKKDKTQNYLKFTQLPLEHIVDISAGEYFSIVCNAEGLVYTFGSPENGQLGKCILCIYYVYCTIIYACLKLYIYIHYDIGHGTTGEFIRDGGKKGPAIQYTYVTKPTQIAQFITKDARGKVIEVRYTINNK